MLRPPITRNLFGAWVSVRTLDTADFLRSTEHQVWAKEVKNMRVPARLRGFFVGKAW